MPVQNVECQIAQLQIARFLQGEPVSADMLKQLEDHIGSCTDCRSHLAERKNQLLTLAGAEQPQPQPEKRKAPSKAVVSTPQPTAKPPIKTLIYSCSLALVLIAMSFVMRDPTALFGSRVEATQPPPVSEKRLAAVPPAEDPAPQWVESTEPTIFVASQMEPIEEGAPVEPPIPTPKPEVVVTVRPPAPKKKPIQPKPAPKKATPARASLRFYDSKGNSINPKTR